MSPKPASVRVVLDTQVVIAAILGGEPDSAWARDIVRAIHRGECTGLISDRIRDEMEFKVREILETKGVTPQYCNHVLANVSALLAKFAAVNPSQAHSISPDPSDDMFFDCAVAGFGGPVP